MGEREARSAEEDHMLRQVVRRKQMGELTVEGLQEVEHLMVRTRTQSTVCMRQREP